VGPRGPWAPVGPNAAQGGLLHARAAHTSGPGVKGGGFVGKSATLRALGGPEGPKLAQIGPNWLILARLWDKNATMRVGRAPIRHPNAAKARAIRIRGKGKQKGGHPRALSGLKLTCYLDLDLGLGLVLVLLLLQLQLQLQL
jgi:hypothetical protein